MIHDIIKDFILNVHDRAVKVKYCYYNTNDTDAPCTLIQSIYNFSRYNYFKIKHFLEFCLSIAVRFVVFYNVANIFPINFIINKINF